MVLTSVPLQESLLATCCSATLIKYVVVTTKALVSSKVVQSTNLAREFIQSSNPMASPYHVQAQCSSCIILDML